MRCKLTIEYDGTGFSGWQRQKRGRTVQGEIEQAMAVFFRREIPVYGQGRTDRGVHAVGQVAHADLPDGTEELRLLSAMRGLLPPDIAVVRVQPAAQDFHARFDALSRRYRYQIAIRPAPLYRHACWVMLKPFDSKLLNDCAKMISGDHDFSNFAKIPDDSSLSSRCVIRISHWSNDDYLWCYTIEGNRFLRHMVRRLVGTMLQVATGDFGKNDFKALLNGGEAAGRKGHAAPPEGLVLENVSY
ncbi:MAG: tRNA pseudouridine(38-40) synthase TruA [Balneolaceae bacterium]